MTTTATDAADTTPVNDATDSTANTDSTTDRTDTDVTDWKAEAAKWKGLADTTDKRAKRLADEARANSAAAKELETLKKQSMSEQEKAVEAARAEARKEALSEVGGKLAEAAIRVAAAGRNVDVDALLEGVDPARFLDDDGDPDVKAITAWMDRVAPAVDDKDKAPVRRDLGQGARGGQAPALNSTQLERDLAHKLGIR